MCSSLKDILTIAVLVGNDSSSLRNLYLFLRLALARIFKSMSSLKIKQNNFLYKVIEIEQTLRGTNTRASILQAYSSFIHTPRQALQISLSQPFFPWRSC